MSRTAADRMPSGAEVKNPACYADRFPELAIADWDPQEALKRRMHRQPASDLLDRQWSRPNCRFAQSPRNRTTQPPGSSSDTNYLSFGPRTSEVPGHLSGNANVVS